MRQRRARARRVRYSEEKLTRLFDARSSESSKAPSESAGAGSGGTSVKMCGPLTPDQALRLYRSQLTPLEQGEIQAYPDVYFVGPNAKKRPAVSGGTNNSGYDDEQGGYIHVAHDHLAYRYEFLKVGREYGRVCVCVCVVARGHTGTL